MNKITTFKIRIDTVSDTHIGFELFVGDRVHDTYVNTLAKGGYGVNNRILLTPTEFADFANRLIAYVYTTKSLDNNQFMILWSLKLNIFSKETETLSDSIFTRDRLEKLGLVKGKE